MASSRLAVLDTASADYCFVANPFTEAALVGLVTAGMDSLIGYAASPTSRMERLSRRTNRPSLFSVSLGVNTIALGTATRRSMTRAHMPKISAIDLFMEALSVVLENAGRIFLVAGPPVAVAVIIGTLVEW